MCAQRSTPSGHADAACVHNKYAAMRGRQTTGKWGKGEMCGATWMQHKNGSACTHVCVRVHRDSTRAAAGAPRARASARRWHPGCQCNRLGIGAAVLWGGVHDLQGGRRERGREIRRGGVGENTGDETRCARGDEWARSCGGRARNCRRQRLWGTKGSPTPSALVPVYIVRFQVGSERCPSAEIGAKEERGC
ncbi:hypothetical protein B0H16DRAFT_1561727, partial [Mycena metata]